MRQLSDCILYLGGHKKGHNFFRNFKCVGFVTVLCEEYARRLGVRI